MLSSLNFANVYNDSRFKSPLTVLAQYMTLSIMTINSEVDLERVHGLLSFKFELSETNGIKVKRPLRCTFVQLVKT